MALDANQQIGSSPNVTTQEIIASGIAEIQIAAVADAGQTIGTTVNTGTVTDDDSAASNGTAVNVVAESNGMLAYLDSTTAGNATVTFEIGSGGPTVVANDNDSPGGVQLYFDEDAAAADSKFLAVSPTGADLFVPAVDGSLIRVVHDASAASNGVAVYIDDDAASAHLKLLFVSPTDADATYTTDDVVSAKIAPTPAEIQTLTDKVDELLVAMRATTSPILAT